MPNITVSPTPAFITGPGVLTQPPGNLVSLDSAVASVQKDFPASAYSIASVNMTSKFAGKDLYEFRMNPIAGATGTGTITAYIDALNGDPYTPGQETARVTPDQAKRIVTTAFTALNPDQVRVRFVNSTSSGEEWNFTLYKNHLILVSGTVDPDSGQLSTFTRTVPLQGRQLSPVLDMGSAQKIADQYIIDQNGGPLPVNMSDGRYDLLGLPMNPAAGQYVFIYNRIVQDIPCDEDGFTITVDSVTGDITGYIRHWSAPEDAFTVAAEPLELRYEATYAVLSRASETYPETAGSVRIVSAEIRWMDHHASGSIPRPGSIPAAWKVQFTDDSIQAQPKPVFGVGWVDTQTGKILEFDYQH